MEPSGRGPGRPRDAALDVTILDHVFEALATVGYDRLRVVDVARSAGVGTSTIYRRWPSKRELVAAAIMHGRDPVDEAELSPKEHLDNVASFLTRHRELLPSLLSALRHDRDLSEAVSDRIRLADQRRVQAHLRSQLGSHVEEDVVVALSEIGPAMLLATSLLDPDANLDDVVRKVLTLIDVIVECGKRQRPQRTPPQRATAPRRRNG